MQALVHKARAAQVAAVMQEIPAGCRLALLIQAVVVAVLMLVEEAALRVAQAVQASSSFPTQAHKEAQAAQLHQAVATLSTHLHLAVHLQLN